MCVVHRIPHPPTEHQGAACSLLLVAAFVTPGPSCCSPLPPVTLPFQVLRMSPAEVYQVRQRMVDLAAHLNQRTLHLLESFFPTPADLGQC